MESEKQLRARIKELEKEVEQYKTQLLKADNKDFALRQELSAVVNEKLPDNKPDAIYVGRTIPQKLGEPSKPYYIPHSVIAKSIGLLGKTGSGKSNFGFVMAKQLMRQKKNVMVFDRSGEWRSMFKPEECIELEHMQFNPFDNLDGFWDDKTMHELITRTFFSFLDAGGRGATNRGNLSNVVRKYLQDFTPENRNVKTFHGYLEAGAEVLDLPKATHMNFLGYLKEFLYNPKLRDIFCCQKTHPRIKDLITKGGNACVVLTLVDDSIKSIITVSILKQITLRMQYEFHQIGSNKPRPLTNIMLIEETADVLGGGTGKIPEGERAWLKSQLRDLRKYGGSLVLYPRNQATLNDMGVTNLMSEIGLISSFQLNEYITIKNPDYQKMMQKYANKLKPGQAIMSCDGVIDLVQVELHYDIVK